MALKGVATLRESVSYVACFRCGRMKMTDRFLDLGLEVKNLLMGNHNHGCTRISFNHELCPECEMGLTSLNIIPPKEATILA